MDSRIKNMTTGSPMKLLFQFALPLMMGNVFQQLYTAVDTAVVGKGLGVDALAALGAADWLNWMILGMVQGLTQGFAILMAQSFGANQFEHLRKVVGNTIVLSAISAVILVALGEAAVAPILRLMKTPEEIMPGALVYLRIMYGGIPIVMAYNLLACILRSLGDSKTPLNAMIVASFVNIGLDLLFVLVFHWGIAGAAAATIIAQGLSAVYCGIRVSKIELLRLTRSHFKLDLRLSGRLFSLGSPMALQNGIIAVGGLIVQMVVNTWGVIFIAGYTATNKLFGILEIAATSYGYAMVTYVGQNLGAGNISRIKKGVRAANGLGFATSLVISAIMLLFGKFLLGMFLSGDPADVSAAMSIAYEYLTVMSICLSALYYLHVIRSTLQGLGNTVLPMVSGIVELVMRLVIVLILPGIIGQMGIFLSEVSAWFGADIVLLISYLFTIHGISRKTETK